MRTLRINWKVVKSLLGEMWDAVLEVLEIVADDASSGEKKYAYNASDDQIIGQN
ncbi:hypothetical protein ACP4OV_023163 [Aristida adscensionis]